MITVRVVLGPPDDPGEPAPPPDGRLEAQATASTLRDALKAAGDAFKQAWWERNDITIESTGLW